MNTPILKGKLTKAGISAALVAEFIGRGLNALTQQRVEALLEPAEQTATLVTQFASLAVAAWGGFRAAFDYFQN